MASFAYCSRLSGDPERLSSRSVFLPFIHATLWPPQCTAAGCLEIPRGLESQRLSRARYRGISSPHRHDSLTTVRSRLPAFTAVMTPIPGPRAATGHLSRRDVSKLRPSGCSVRPGALLLVRAPITTSSDTREGRSSRSTLPTSRRLPPPPVSIKVARFYLLILSLAVYLSISPNQTSDRRWPRGAEQHASLSGPAKTDLKIHRPGSNRRQGEGRGEGRSPSAVAFVLAPVYRGGIRFSGGGRRRT